MLSVSNHCSHRYAAFDAKTGLFIEKIRFDLLQDLLVVSIFHTFHTKFMLCVVKGFTTKFVGLLKMKNDLIVRSNDNI